MQVTVLCLMYCNFTGLDTLIMVHLVQLSFSLVQFIHPKPGMVHDMCNVALGSDESKQYYLTMVFIISESLYQWWTWFSKSSVYNVINCVPKHRHNPWGIGPNNKTFCTFSRLVKCQFRYIMKKGSYVTCTWNKR